jgi:WD40 repeat protein
VLSAGADGLLKLWDSRTGASLSTFEGHDDRVWGLAESSGPAEALLASGGWLCCVEVVGDGGKIERDRDVYRERCL